MKLGNNLRWLIAGIVALLLLGGGYLLLKGDNEAQSTNQSEASPTNPSINNSKKDIAGQTIVLEDAIKKIGMVCSGPDFEAECTWEGLKYTLSKPSDWSRDIKLRQQACDQGYINTGYLIVSDKSTWTISTDQNSDSVKLADALKGAGAIAEAIHYC